MTPLSIPGLAALANQLFLGERSFDDLIRAHHVEEFIESLDQCLHLLEERVNGLNEAQFHFRVPGVPGGPDWNHDQHHFNAPELVTHLLTVLRAWQSALRAEGLPLADPTLPFAPTEDVTGKEGPGFGAGGRHDLSVEETLLDLRTARSELLPGLRRISARQWEKIIDAPILGPMSAARLVKMMAIHSGAHAFQLLEIQAHEAYPS